MREIMSVYVRHTSVTELPKTHLNSTEDVDIGTTYARLGLFVIGRSADQVRSSAPVS